MKGQLHTKLTVRAVLLRSLAVAVAAGLLSCGGGGGGGGGGGEPVKPALEFPCVSWCSTIAPWPHDGQPYESEIATVYGDGTSLEAKKQLATIAEDLLDEIETLLALQPVEQYLPRLGQSKLHLYAYHYHNPQQWGGTAWIGGFMVYAIDHPERSAAGLTELGDYTRLIKHELIHAVQNLIVGSNHSYSTHTWFEEGLAEFLSELNPQYRIDTLTSFDERVATFGTLNPIAIENDVLPDILNVGSHYYYPMFELTMRYLLDPKGLGAELADVKGVFEDMAGGTSFEEAFSNRFGMPVHTLRTEFFTRLRAYLEATAHQPQT